MTIVALLPVIVAIVGALIFGLTKDKLSTLGLGAFYAGMFAICFAFAGRLVHFF